MTVNNISCRVFHLYGPMVQFYKIINLPFVPHKNEIIVLEDKNYEIKHVVINYKPNNVGVDLYIEKNKKKEIDDLISKENALFPTHLANQDSLSKLE